MQLVFDLEKNARNIELRRLPFSAVERFEFDAALIVEDDRRGYGETRFVALDRSAAACTWLSMSGSKAASGSSVSGKPTLARGGDTKMKADPERTDEDSPEWTDEMFARAMRIGDLPEDHRRTLRAVGRPKKPDAKVLISLRVKPSLAEAYKAKGKGWRLEMERVLADAVNK